MCVTRMSMIPVLEDDLSTRSTVWQNDWSRPGSSVNSRLKRPMNLGRMESLADLWTSMVTLLALAGISLLKNYMCFILKKLINEVN